MDEGEERGTMPGIAIAAIVAAIWALAIMAHVDDAILRYVENGDKAGAAGAYLAQTLVPAVVIWLVLYFAYVRRRAPSRGFTHFMLLFVVVSGIELGGLALRFGVLPRPENPVAMPYAPTEVELKIALGRAQSNIDTALRPRGGTLNLYTDAVGPAGDLDRRIKDLADDLGAAAADRLHQLDALGYPVFMLPTEFADMAGLALARAKLAAARAVLLKEKAKEQSLIADFRVWVAARSPLKRDEQKVVLAAVDAAMKNGGAARTRYGDLMLAQIAEFEAEARDLRNTRLPWQLLRGELFFADAHDLTVFRRHTDTIRTIDRQARAVYAGEN